MAPIDDGRDALLIELHALADQPLPASERKAVMDLLLLEELDDLALGRRHLTIVHGWIGPEDELTVLNPMLDAAAAQLGDRCVRMVAGPFHCTVTIAGPDADSVAGSALLAMAASLPAAWRLVASARPA